MEKINLNSKQVHEFGMSICTSDIITYIETHKKEYEDFLKTENHTCTTKESRYDDV